MDDQLVSILSQTLLPMAERMSEQNFVVPGIGGKRSIGEYPPPEKSIARGVDILNQRVGPYSAHTQVVEWVFGLSGKAELALHGQRYELAEGDVGIIPEGIKHVERIRDARQDFHLIWFCCNLRSSILTIHSSSFCGGNRFQLINSARIERCRDLCQLFMRAADEANAQGQAWDSLLRATVVSVVVQIMRHLREHGAGFMTPQHQASVIDIAKAFIQSRFARPLTLAEIAQSVFLSPNYFSSLFTQTAGMTVFDYVRRVRLEEAQRLLAQTRLPIRDVAKTTGFPTRSHFVRSFRKHAGCLPRDYRRRQKPSQV